MDQMVGLIKALENAGIAGLIVYLIYRLVDKWAPKFLAERQEQTKAITQQTEAMSQQATALTQLAETQKVGMERQHETEMAVRALAAQIERQERYLQLIEEHIVGERGR
jgi:hypothetical protein